jgi:hypothetical protein
MFDAVHQRILLKKSRATVDAIKILHTIAQTRFDSQTNVRSSIFAHTNMARKPTL